MDDQDISRRLDRLEHRIKVIGEIAVVADAVMFYWVVTRVTFAPPDWTFLPGIAVAFACGAYLT